MNNINKIRENINKNNKNIKEGKNMDTIKIFKELNLNRNLKIKIEKIKNNKEVNLIIKSDILTEKDFYKIKDYLYYNNYSINNIIIQNNKKIRSIVFPYFFGNLNIINTNINDLYFKNEKIFGNLIIKNTSIKQIDRDLEIGGDLIIDNTLIENLIFNNLGVKGNLIIKNNKYLKNIEFFNSNYVCRNIIIENNPNLINVESLPDLLDGRLEIIYNNKLKYLELPDFVKFDTIIEYNKNLKNIIGGIETERLCITTNKFLNFNKIKEWINEENIKAGTYYVNLKK